MSRLMTLITLLTALLSTQAHADSALSPDAMQTVRAYFTALQSADVDGLQELADGRMKVRLERLSRNNAYAEQLRQNYGGATFTIGQIETKPSLVLVDYEMAAENEALKKRLYLRQGHGGWRIIAETTVP